MSSKWKSKSNSSKGFEMSDKSYPLSKNRFISVSEFRNQIRVDIREYYFDADGDRKPTKKGINLSLEEWNKLKNFVPKVEKAIKGIDGSDISNDSDSEPQKKSKKKSKKSDSDSDDDSDNRHKKSKKVKKSESDEDSDDSQQKNKSKKSKVLSDSDSD